MPRVILAHEAKNHSIEESTTVFIPPVESATWHLRLVSNAHQVTHLHVTDPLLLPLPSLPFLASVGCMTTFSNASRESSSMGFCSGMTWHGFASKITRAGGGGGK